MIKTFYENPAVSGFVIKKIIMNSLQLKELLVSLVRWCLTFGGGTKKGKCEVMRENLDERAQKQ